MGECGAAGAAAAPLPYAGVVRQLRSSFGFIRSPQLPRDTFFHATSCEPPELFSSLAPGAAVAFELDQQQPAGKQAARRVTACSSSEAAAPVVVKPELLYGWLVHAGAGPGTRGSSAALLRYLGGGQPDRVQHLTFRVPEDLAAGVSPDALQPSPVRFRLARDRRLQLLAHAGPSASAHAPHGHTWATHVAPVTPQEQAQLDPGQQQQLAVLEALASAFDADRRGHG